MRIVIDGYNLMYAKGLMDRTFGPEGLHKARQRFLSDLAAAFGPMELAGIVVVFDAAHPPPNRPRSAVYRGITVLFAVDDENADERIEKLIAAHSTPKTLTVVSSDARVRQAAERRRARAVSADAFLADLVERRPRIDAAAPPASAEDRAKQNGLAPAESRFWMETFAHVAEEPGLARALRAADFVPTDDEIRAIEREVREEFS